MLEAGGKAAASSDQLAVESLNQKLSYEQFTGNAGEYATDQQDRYQADRQPTGQRAWPPHRAMSTHAAGRIT
jgi:hypothetical protein